MTAPDVVELGRRAVACAGWRWVPGMLIADSGPGVRLVWTDETYMHGSAEESQGWMRLRKDRGYAPDLTDHATLGALLGLVREAWAKDGAPVVYLEPEGRREIELGTGWEAYACYPGGRVEMVGYGETEAKALVVALERAPVRS